MTGGWSGATRLYLYGGFCMGKSKELYLFKEVEFILKESRNYERIIKIYELNKKLHQEDAGYIKEINNSIELCKQKDLNVTRCLELLSPDELKFVEAKYFDNKTNRELIPLTNKILYGDENIDKKISIQFSTLVNNATKVKKDILTKLLNENILGVI